MFENKPIDEQLDDVLALLVGKGDSHKHYITFLGNIMLPDDSMIFVDEEYIGTLVWEANPKVEVLEKSLDDMDPTPFVRTQVPLKQIILDHLKTLEQPETYIQKVWFDLT